MTTTLHRRPLTALAVLAALALGFAANTRAQAPAKPDDDALESLIDKLNDQGP
jgi:hypothetical protein